MGSRFFSNAENIDPRTDIFEDTDDESTHFTELSASEVNGFSEEIQSNKLMFL